MDKIVIKLDSFNLDKAALEIIKLLIEKEGGNFTLNQYADALGMNTRTLYRFKLDNNIIFPRKGSKGFNEELAIKKLESRGFTVTKSP